jgi:cell division septation protein DedD
MTRMADPGRPRDDQDYDDERFEDEGRRSIFSALWFRAILVVIVLGVVAAVAVPYVLELANQPAPKTAVVGKPEMTPAPVAPPAPPAPPIASAPAPSPMPEKSSTPEKSSAMDKPATSESAASAAAAQPTEKPSAPAKSESSKSTVASKTSTPREPAAAPREQPVARAPRAPSPMGASGDYFVQVGAFKNPDTARKLAGRLREQKYHVEETTLTTTVKTARPATAAASQPSGSANDRYDVHVTGATPAEINAKLAPKGLSAEPAGAGVVVKPSMALRDAVALSKDLAVDGLKVQVRRAAAGSAPAPAPASAAAATSDGTLYRVRVGPFDDKTTATSTLRELQQKGYSAFIARGGQ